MRTLAKVGPIAPPAYPHPPPIPPPDYPSPIPLPVAPPAYDRYGAPAPPPLRSRRCYRRLSALWRVGYDETSRDPLAVTICMFASISVCVVCIVVTVIYASERPPNGSRKVAYVTSGVVMGTAVALAAACCVCACASGRYAGWARVEGPPPRVYIVAYYRGAAAEPERVVVQSSPECRHAWASRVTVDARLNPAHDAWWAEPAGPLEARSWAGALPGVDEARTFARPGCPCAV